MGLKDSARSDGDAKVVTEGRFRKQRMVEESIELAACSHMSLWASAGRFETRGMWGVGWRGLTSLASFIAFVARSPK